MSTIHKQITKEEIENPDLDKELLSLLTAQTEVYVVNKEDVQRDVSGRQTQTDAVSGVAKHFDSFFGNEEKLCRLVMQEYHSKIPNQRELMNGVSGEKKRLEDSGNHQEKGEERFTGSKNTALGIKFAKGGSWALYILGFISTVYFLVTIAGMEWLNAIILPLAGVSVIYWGGKFLLWSLSHAKTPIYPTIKYSIGVIGIGFAVMWLYYYSKLVGSMTEAIDIGSLSDSSSPSSGNHESNIMIYLGALGEAFVGAFLYAVGNDIKEKHTIYDGIRDTQEYTILKAKFEKTEKDLKFSNDRINHAQNLLAIVEGKREHVKSEAASIYNELFHASIN